MINFNSKLILSLFTILLNIFNCSVFLTIPNFDVREKFRDCYFDGVSSTYNNIVCNTNWPIQFSMMLTDKLCIEKNLKRNSKTYKKTCIFKALAYSFKEFFIVLK